MPDRQASMWYLLAAFLAVFAAGFYYRAPSSARELETYPDAVEYAVAAYRFATLGRYTIEINGVEYPPRYPPGFSVLFLSPAYLLAPGDIGNGIFPVLACAITTVVAAFAIGYRLGGPWSGVGAVVVLLYLRLYTEWARQIMSDGPSVTLALVGACLFLRMRSKATVVGYAQAGIVAAVAYALRVLNMTLVLPFLWLVVRARAGRARKLLALLVPSAIAVVASALYNQATFGDWRRTGYQFWCPVPYDYFNLTFSLRYVANNLEVFRHAAMLWPYGIGLFGVAVLWRRRTQDLPALLGFVGLTAGTISLVYLFYFYSDPIFHTDLRFHLLGQVFFCILGGAGLAQLIPVGVRRQVWPLPMLLLLPLFVWPQRYRPPSFRAPLARALAAATPANAVIISRVDSVYLDQLVVRGTQRRVLPDSREEEYADKAVAAKRVDHLDPPPRSINDHRAIALLRGGAKDVHSLVATEATDQIATWIHAGVPVYFDSASIPRSAPSRLKIAQHFRLQPDRRYPWLLRLQLPEPARGAAPPGAPGGSR